MPFGLSVVRRWRRDGCTHTPCPLPYGSRCRVVPVTDVVVSRLTNHTMVREVRGGTIHY